VLLEWLGRTMGSWSTRTKQTSSSGSLSWFSWRYCLKDPCNRVFYYYPDSNKTFFL